jgi:tetratricopeptide (TPR) repeat protein/predicted regulator of Ras-like GTPase activity (Roadblock/LC7/MglB family)
VANANEAAIDAIIQSYSDKVKQNPDSLLFVQLADAYRKKGAFDQALEVLRTGLVRHNNLLSGLLMMGRIHCAKREYGEAIEALRKVVQREPSNMTAHALLSQCYVSTDRWPEAIGEYQKILSLNPEDAAAQAALRDALDRLRRDKVVRTDRALPADAGTAVVPKTEPSPKPESVKPAASVPPSPPPPALPIDQPIAAVAAAAPPLGAVGPPARVSAAQRTAPLPEARAPMEAPAFAAAEELAARGLYEEAVEALQRILEADPDNFMARQKLREVYAQREAMESPSMAAASAVPAPAAPATEAPAAGGTPAPAAAAESQADKITDDEILYLLGLMEDASAPSAAASSAPAPVPTVAPKAEPKPQPKAEPKPEPEPEPEPEPKPEPAAVPAAAPSAVPVPQTAQGRTAPAAPTVTEPAVATRSEPAVSTATEPAVAAASGLSEAATAKVTEILTRFGTTEGLRQAYFISGPSVVMAGQASSADQSAKITTLVSMLADLTRRAASSMKQGEVKQVLVFGTDGLVMVSPAATGILAAVAGGSVKVGLLRIALNDCLKRLADVS